jgi:small conductance mechanosensitive channel
MKAKQIIDSIMVEDPRVNKTPRPVVYLMSLEKGYMELQGRGWTDNVKAFVVTRELLEKTKLRFDQEGFALAVPQLQVHYSMENTSHPLKEI